MITPLLRTKRIIPENRLELVSRPNRITEYFIEDDGQVLVLRYLDRNGIKRLYVGPAATSRRVGSSIMDSAWLKTGGQSIDYFALISPPASLPIYPFIGHQSLDEEALDKVVAEIRSFKMKNLSKGEFL